MLETPQYLGDGVYALSTPSFPLVLRTGSHLEQDANNNIYFEPETLEALIMILKKGNFIKS